MGALRSYYTRRARFLFVERGLRQGNRFWLVFGGALVAGRLLRRTFGRVSETLSIEQLAPGQSVVITAIAPPTRADKRAARAARRGAGRAG